MNNNRTEVEKRLSHFLDQDPVIHSTAYIHEKACLMGAVTIGENCSIWPMAVVRADINRIEIGMGSNIQDGVVIHLSDEYPVCIGEYVTVGHSAVIHACTIGDECLIGMNATIMDGAVIGEQCIIAAGALVPPGTRVPPGSMVAGVPGKITKKLSDTRRQSLKNWAYKYIHVSRYYISRRYKS